MATNQPKMQVDWFFFFFSSSSSSLLLRRKMMMMAYCLLYCLSVENYLHEIRKKWFWSKWRFKMYLYTLCYTNEIFSVLKREKKGIDGIDGNWRELTDFNFCSRVNNTSFRRCPTMSHCVPLCPKMPKLMKVLEWWGVINLLLGFFQCHHAVWWQRRRRRRIICRFPIRPLCRCRCEGSDGTTNKQINKLTRDRLVESSSSSCRTTNAVRRTNNCSYRVPSPALPTPAWHCSS